MAKNIQKFVAGEYVFHEGDMGREMFIIQEGAVEVLKGLADGEVLLAILGKSDFFGEMALFGNRKRSASIKAKTDCTLLVIEEKTLKKQFSQLPEWFSAMFQVLVNRIRQMDAKIVSQFKLGIEFSILQILYLLIDNEGEKRNDGSVKLSVETAIARMQSILGLSPDMTKQKLREFEFIKLLMFEENKGYIEITDWLGFQQFIQFVYALNEIEKSSQIYEKLPGVPREKIAQFIKLHHVVTRGKESSLTI